MRQMLNCHQCRADAIGTLGDDRSIEFRDFGKKKEVQPEEKTDHKVRPLLFAVTSRGGVLVDQHFGQATDFYIYEATEAGPRLRERRSSQKYCTDGCSGAMDGSGTGTDRIEDIIDTISDCVGVVCMRMGEAPKRTLAQRGIDVFTTYDRIEDAVEKAVKKYLATHAGAPIQHSSDAETVREADNAAIAAYGVSGDALATPFTAPKDTTPKIINTEKSTTKEAIAQ
jgi:predicted Fe-Mo cluster-binding NifX family protein